MTQRAAWPDFHNDVVGTRKPFHKASPTSFPSGHIVAVKNAVLGASGWAVICLFVLEGAAVWQSHRRIGRRGVCIAPLESSLSSPFSGVLPV